MHGLWCTYCYGAAPGLATRWARVPPCPSDPLPPQPSPVRAALGEADGTEPPAAGNGWFSAGAAGSPRGVPPCCFINISIFL